MGMLRVIAALTARAWTTPGTPSPGDTTPPTVADAYTNNASPTSVELDMSEAIDPNYIPSTSAFTVTGSVTGAKTVTGIGIGDPYPADWVSIVVSVAFQAGETITVSYTQPGTNAVRDIAGNQLASFTNLDVRNEISGGGDATAPTVVSRTATSATNIRVVYSEDVNASVAGHTFNNGGTLTPSAATAVNSTTVDYTVSGLAPGQTITHTYVEQGTGAGTRDTAGNQLAAFSNQAVTNSVPDTTAPTIVSATAINATTIRIIYSEAVNASVAGHTFDNAGTLTPSAATQVNATTVNYTVAGLAFGQTITRTYVQQGTGAGTRDTAGNQLAAYSAQVVTNDVPDTGAAPQIVEAYVVAENPDWIEVFFNRNLDPASIPAFIRFTPSGGKTVVDVDVAGAGQTENQLSVQVDPPYGSGDTIDLDYLKPTTNPLQATDGVDVESFSNYPIENRIGGSSGGGGDTTEPTVVSMAATSATNIRVVYSEAVTPTLPGWTFNNGDSISPTAVTQISGTTWDFTVAGLANGQTITGSYAAGTGNTIDLAGNELASFTASPVDNQIPPAGSGDSLTFTAIPYSDPEVRRPGAGAESWHDQELEGLGVDIPTEGARQEPKDRFGRSFYHWYQLEGTQGQYFFDAVIGGDIQTAISKGQKFGFGYMTLRVGNDGDPATPIAGGAGMSYPMYLHNLMQAETTYKDFIDGAKTEPWWVPNYNSASYQNRLDALNLALANWLASTSYMGVLYKDAIRYIDVRGVGDYGEWHHVDHSDVTTWSTAETPTSASLIAIIDSFCNRFADYQLMAIDSVFDAYLLANTWIPPAVAEHVITKTYGGGKKLGIRRDNFGSGNSYISMWLENNNRGTISGQPYSYYINERWKEAPFLGEPNRGGDGSGDTSYQLMEGEMSFYHVTSFGNGNLAPQPLSTANKNYIRAASKRAGHRLKLNSGTLSTSIVRGTPFSMSLTWANDGVCPTYENWEVDIELRSGSTVVWTAQSSAVLRLFLPGTMVVNDGFTIPTSVAAGTYNLHLIIRNVEWPARIMPLHITGVQGDGSYILKSNVVVS